MTVVDIHPEELLDKLVRGELSPAEWDHLEAHLETCAVCRLELDLRQDFQPEAAAIELPRMPSRSDFRSRAPQRKGWRFPVVPPRHGRFTLACPPTKEV